MQAKRFWKKTSVKTIDKGFTITLDGKPIATPGGKSFEVDSAPLADAICKEWDSQSEAITPDTMPIYKFAVTAIDRVAPHRQSVIDELSTYANSDLLCYRESQDQRLAAHQNKVWQPYIDWATETYAIELKIFQGIMPQPQPQATRQKLKQIIEEHSNFYLSGIHHLVSTTGSLILSLSAAKQDAPLDAIFEAAFLDDLWQQDKWGYDSEAANRLTAHREQMADAYRYIDFLRG